MLRKASSRKRGDDKAFVTLTTTIAERVLESVELLAGDDALGAPGNVAPDLKDLMELRYFAGLSIAEISQLTGKSARNVEREWERRSYCAS